MFQRLLPLERSRHNYATIDLLRAVHLPPWCCKGWKHPSIYKPPHPESSSQPLAGILVYSLISQAFPTSMQFLIASSFPLCTSQLIRHNNFRYFVLPQKWASLHVYQWSCEKYFTIQAFSTLAITQVKK